MRTGVAVAAVVALAIALPIIGKRAADAAADTSADTETGDGSTAFDWINPWGAIERQVEQNNTEQAMTDANVTAFLTTIATAEGTDREADPYGVCYGYRHTVRDFSDHPAVTDEWRGESIANLGPRYAGMVSTAAGRYQIIKATWLRAKRALGLSDFSPASQDAAAVWLIGQRGALDAIRRGDFAQAINTCSTEWASLPGSTSGQPQRKLEQLAQVFTDNGGTLA